MTDRIANLTRSETCGYCSDDGTAVVSHRAPELAMVMVKGKLTKREPVAGEFYEEYGPCPWCEKGYQIEFGIGHKLDARGQRQEYRNPHPPWRDGFWKGRPTVVAESPPKHSIALPTKENHIRSLLLLARYDAIRRNRTENLPDPCIGLEPLIVDPRQRIRLLEIEAAKRPHRPSDDDATTEPELKPQPFGRCDDCEAEDVERWQYGKFTLCRSCCDSRVRVAAQLARLL